MSATEEPLDNAWIGPWCVSVRQENRVIHVATAECGDRQLFGTGIDRAAAIADVERKIVEFELRGS